MMLWLLSRFIPLPKTAKGPENRPGPKRKLFQPSLTQPMDPDEKSLNFIFPTRYVVPKSLKFSQWPSKIHFQVLLLLVSGRVKFQDFYLHEITKLFRYLKWRNPHLYKLYGYGLCKGVNPPPKIAGYKVQETLHFRSLKLLVMKTPCKPYQVLGNSTTWDLESGQRR